jgi:hypothetical protein
MLQQKRGEFHRRNATQGNNKTNGFSCLGEQGKEAQGNGFSAANPNWQVIYEWARYLVRNIVTDNFRCEFWIDEFASAAVYQLCPALRRHHELEGEQWYKFAKTVMSRTIKRDFLREFTKGKVSYSLNFRNEEQSAQPSSDSLEFHRVNKSNLDGGMTIVEDMYDLAVEFAGFFEALTPSERRVLPEQVGNPSATSDEVAQWANFRTGSAVRFHEKNLKSKACAFVKTHPHKKEWQRYLSDVGAVAVCDASTGE